jgi:hypothetical protein
VLSFFCVAAIRCGPSDYKRQDQPLLLDSQRALFSALRRVHSQVVGDGSVPQPQQNPNPSTFGMRQVTVCASALDKMSCGPSVESRHILSACVARMPPRALHIHVVPLGATFSIFAISRLALGK